MPEAIRIDLVRLAQRELLGAFERGEFCLQLEAWRAGCERLGLSDRGIGQLGQPSIERDRFCYRIAVGWAYLTAEQRSSGVVALARNALAAPSLDDSDATELAPVIPLRPAHTPAPALSTKPRRSLLARALLPEKV